MPRSLVLVCFTFLLASHTSFADLPRLAVSENDRFLQTADGKPFFYLGDTAWEMFHRLDRDEAARYLGDRAEKGFNVIQAVALAEFNGLDEPNRYGEKPLINNDPSRPNPTYFEHVDWIVKKANDLGMYVGLLPTWGDKFNKKWGIGPEVFTPDNARAYGEFLGKRYKDAGIIWILGGDRPIENGTHRAIVNAMAEGLAAGDGGVHLMTYHPMGGNTSANWFHDADWLDFNMLQSGHGARDIANYDMIARDYKRTPPKPCLDGEPRYEDHPINWKPDNGWFDEHDVRKAAYWSVFAGGCGVTYGCHDVWQFLSDAHPPVSSARTPWTEAIDLPAASQMQHLKELMLSGKYFDRIPDQSLIVGDAGKGGEHVQATRAKDRSEAFVYFPTRKTISIDLSKLDGDVANVSWFDPRTGKSQSAGERRDNDNKFTPPEGGPDWVLVLREK